MVLASGQTRRGMEGAGVREEAAVEWKSERDGDETGVMWWDFQRQEKARLNSLER